MHSKFTKKSVRYAAWFLKTIGVHVLETRPLIYTLHHFIFLYLFLETFSSTLFYIYNKRKQLDEAIVAAAFLGAEITLICSILNFIHNKSKILKIFKIIDKNVYSYPDEKNIKIPFKALFNENNVLKIYILVFTYECFGFSLSAASPIIGYLLTGVYDMTMYPASYPWIGKKLFSQILVIFIQICGVITAFWVCYSLQLFVVFFTIEFSRQCARLQAALSTITHRTEQTMIILSRSPLRSNLGYLKMEYHEIYRENIVHCIRHCQQLRKLYVLFKSWFEVFFAVELAISAVTFALVFYNLLMATNQDKFLTIIGSSFNVMANFFSRCLVGELFFEMNLKIMNTISHDVNWYDQSKQNQKLLLILHTMANRPYKLSGFSIFSASHYTFAYILRMSYSYFNIIRSSLNT